MDDLEWEKVRLLAYFSANGKFWTKGFAAPQSLMGIPSIDKKANEEFAQRMLKKIAGLTKNGVAQ